MAIFSRAGVIERILEHCEIILEVREKVWRDVTDPQSEAVASIKPKATLIRARLDRLSDDQLRRFYDKIVRTQWGDIAHRADFNHWGRMDGWTLEEATALLLGKEPNLIDDELLNEPFAGPYWELQQLILRAQEMHILPPVASPLQVLNWADRNKIQYPEVLKKKILEKIRHDTEIDSTELQQQVAAQAELIAQLKNDKDRLSLENEKLRREMEDWLKEDKSGWNKSRNSLLKLVLGMAVAWYGHNPKLGKTETAKQIQGDLNLKGISIDEDTIRNWLTQAAQEVSVTPAED